MEIDGLAIAASMIVASSIAVLSLAVDVLLQLSLLRQSWFFLALHLH